MAYFWLFVLPAAPNPCHRVSVGGNMSWGHAMCLSALLSRPAGSGCVALLFPSRCASSPVSTAGWKQGCQGRDLLEEMALLPPRAALQGLQLGLGSQQEGLATQAQVGSRDLASIPQSVRAVISMAQSLSLK